uniref:Uncharacterized protein n=2 Tax=Nemorhina TaxID=44051 RepID=A0A1B0B190_9MUSC
MFLCNTIDTLNKHHISYHWLVSLNFSIMYILWLSFLIVYVAICEAQFLYHQSSGIGGNPYYQSSGAGQFAHPAVVDNSLRESQLPPELSKSHRFLNNPHIAAALAKDSWFTGNEMPVFDREAEKIPRDMVYKLFKNAGWIKRR